MPGYARAPRGQHFLASARLAAELVTEARIGPTDCVVEIGAGTGILTRALADEAAMVLAIELDHRLVERLRRQLARMPNVAVFHADALDVPLPSTPYRVVANLPFGRTAAILARLLEPTGALTRADVIVQWQVARARAQEHDLAAVQSGPWWELRRGRRLPASSFRPSPSVDAAVQIAQRRAPALLPVDASRSYAAFVRREWQRHPAQRVEPVERWVARYLRSAARGGEPRPRARLSTSGPARAAPGRASRTRRR